MSPRTTVIVPSVATNGIDAEICDEPAVRRAGIEKHRQRRRRKMPMGMPGVPRSIMSVAPTIAGKGGHGPDRKIKTAKKFDGEGHAAGDDSR